MLKCYNIIISIKEYVWHMPGIVNLHFLRVDEMLAQIILTWNNNNNDMKKIFIYICHDMTPE